MWPHVHKLKASENQLNEWNGAWQSVFHNECVKWSICYGYQDYWHAHLGKKKYPLDEIWENGSATHVTTVESQLFGCQLSVFSLIQKPLGPNVSGYLTLHGISFLIYQVLNNYYIKVMWVHIYIILCVNLVPGLIGTMQAMEALKIASKTGSILHLNGFCFYQYFLCILMNNKVQWISVNSFFL